MQQTISSTRLRLRKSRNDIPPTTRRRYNRLIHQHLLTSGLFNRGSRIAGYLAYDGEPSIDLIIQRQHKANRPFYLPALRKQQLTFKAYRFNDTLANNKFNIPEPTGHQSFNPKYLNTILMPLVGFDGHGNRLGMGGGFYDRTLRFTLPASCKKHPLLIGIAYSQQKVNRLLKQPWDIPLDAVITEQGLQCFSIKSLSLLRPPTR
ncbi:MAG: 5-formyltetrahydrofolate cyclo-ligase [Cycloclasticus sp.]|nr:5-formyltetrahydrofolate cyclo-ligase [Cycloclasticus sp.]MBQ0790860.1 5-formyltetrahydrofolate cyclo-ligase [Cycloclasticus sp.]